MELRLVPARAEGQDQPAGADLVDGGGHLRQHGGGVERRARNERSEAHTLGDRGQPRQHRPRLPWAPLGPPVVAVEEVVAEPDRVEPDLLGGSGHGHVFGPGRLALDLGQLDPDAERTRHRVQPRTSDAKAANASVWASTSASVVAGDISAMLWNGVIRIPRFSRYTWTRASRSGSFRAAAWPPFRGGLGWEKDFAPPPPPGAGPRGPPPAD